MTSEHSNAEQRPGPRGHPILGVLLDVLRDRLSLMQRGAEEYGDIVRFKMGPKSLYLFNHPDHVKHVLIDNVENYPKGIGEAHAKRALGEGLLTSHGELWRAQRRATQPAFHRDRLADFASAVADAAEETSRRWRLLSAGEHIDFVEEMTQLTLRVLGRALLDMDLAPYVSMADAFEVVQDQAMFEMSTLGVVPRWLPSSRNRRFLRARKELDTIVQQLVDDHARNPRVDKKDLISLLIASCEAEPDQRAAARRIRDEMVTILLAGHETTASTLSWAFYELSRHRSIADKIHEEVHTVLGDTTPTHQDLSRLPYTTAVINETLRVHPPIWILPRRATEPDEIAGTLIPAGTDVLICPYTLHRHPDFWPDPERFDPERFLGARNDRHRHAFIPFGAGPRFCVGSNLGMLEAILVTAMIGREFRLDVVPDSEVVPEPLMVLRIRGGLPMTVRTFS